MWGPVCQELQHCLHGAAAAGKYGHEARMLAPAGHNKAGPIKGHDTIEITTEGNKEATSSVVLHSIYHHTFSNIHK
jgi:hypothetical protein